MANSTKHCNIKANLVQNKSIWGFHVSINPKKQQLIQTAIKHRYKCKQFAPLILQSS